MVVLRRARHHAFEDVGEIDLGIDFVKLGRVEKRGEDRPGFAAAFVATEETILFSDADRPDRTRDNVRVRLQPPVIQKQRQARPAFERVVDRSDQSRLARYSVLRSFQKSTGCVDTNTRASEPKAIIASRVAKR